MPKAARNGRQNLLPGRTASGGRAITHGISRPNNWHNSMAAACTLILCTADHNSNACPRVPQSKHWYRPNRTFTENERLWGFREPCTGHGPRHWFRAALLVRTARGGGPLASRSARGASRKSMPGIVLHPFSGTEKRNRYWNSASLADRAESMVRLGRYRRACRGPLAAADVSELADPGRQRSPLLSIRHRIVAIRRTTATRAMLRAATPFDPLIPGPYGLIPASRCQAHLGQQATHQATALLGDRAQTLRFARAAATWRETRKFARLRPRGNRSMPVRLFLRARHKHSSYPLDSISAEQTLAIDPQQFAQGVRVARSVLPADRTRQFAGTFRLNEAGTKRISATSFSRVTAFGSGMGLAEQRRASVPVLLRQRVPPTSANP